MYHTRNTDALEIAAVTTSGVDVVAAVVVGEAEGDWVGDCVASVVGDLEGVCVGV
jgi:hypothetical protein